MTDTDTPYPEPTAGDFIERAKSLDEAAHKHSRENYPHFRHRAFVNRAIARDLLEAEAKLSEGSE